MANEGLIPRGQNHTNHSEKKKCCYWLCHVTTEAFLDEEDLLNYISKVENLLSKSVIGVVVFLLSYAFSITSLAVGILHIGSCPCQPVLPLFLIIHGSAMCVRCLFGTIKICSKHKSDSDEGCSPLETFSNICGVMILFWTITGSIWVFSIVLQVNTEVHTDMEYCHPLIYYYSVVLVTAVMTGIILRVVFVCTISVIYYQYENRSLYSHLMTEKYGNFV